MSRPWVRLSLVIIAVAVALAAGYRLFDSARQRNTEHVAAQAYDTLAWTLTVRLADLRAAQQAYVASGQYPDEWYPRVTTELGELTDGLANLRTMSRQGAAIEAVEAVDALVERLRRVDESARSHAENGQVLLASDLVFTDGQDLTRQAREQLAIARKVESEAFGGLRTERRAADATMAAVATIAVIGVMLALLPLADRSKTNVPVARDDASGHLDVSAAAEVSLGVTDLASNQFSAAADLDISRESTQPRDRSIASTDQASGVVGAENDSLAPAIPDLTTTATLCTDLARVSASDELADVLSRAGELLNASGLIVWVRDSTGSALRPAAGHGYGPQVLSRLGRVACDEENATATAYRTAQIQVVAGGSNEPGAVAVPLMSAAGSGGPCVGVLSAEIRHGWEASVAVQATARILAAQLATCVSADPRHAQDVARDPAQAHG